MNLQSKIAYSISLLHKCEQMALDMDSENGFYLAFSGGKDSQALYHIAKMAGVKFKAHMNLTSVDPPEVIRFVKRNYPDVELTIIPGVTAATGGAAVLGAPLIHDFCLISLSDLLTPWEKIEARLLAAAQADFVVCLYNPSSRKRKDYLQKACDLMMKYKSPDTVCGTVAQIARDGETAQVMTLKELRDTEVDMFTTVFVGNSQTKNVNGKMVTPRGYKNV